MSSPLRTFLAAAALVLTLAPSAYAAIRVDGKPKVSFFATGSPGWLDIEGVASSISAADDGTKLTFTVPMTSVSTGIGMRDDHMNKEFVQVDKFPNAILSFAKADVTWPAAGGAATEGSVNATFNIHGVDQPVTVTYNVGSTKTGYRVKAKFNFDASAAGISIPSYMGVTVDPKMRSEVTLDLVDG